MRNAKKNFLLANKAHPAFVSDPDTYRCRATWHSPGRVEFLSKGVVQMMIPGSIASLAWLAGRIAGIKSAYSPRLFAGAALLCLCAAGLMLSLHQAIEACTAMAANGSFAVCFMLFFFTAVTGARLTRQPQLSIISA